MKKTLIIATAAGLAMASGVEEQDNELFMNAIKNGYYTVSNAILSRPAMIAGGMQMVQNGMARPTFLNHFDEAADDEFMAKGHGQGKEKSKGKKNKDGKKPKPQPVQEPEQAQDNNLAFDDEFGALNVGVNGGNNGFGANAGYQGNIGKNGNFNVGGQIQTQPGGRPNWGVNAGVTIKFDEQEDEFYAEDQDDEFFVEDLQDNELGDLNLGVKGGNNGFGANAGYTGNVGRGNLNVGGSIQTNPGSKPSFGANAGYQQNIGKNGNWNVGGQIQTQPGGRPNWGVNAGVTIKFDEQDDEFYAEDQDDEFFVEDLQDNELGNLNVGVNGGNNGFGANAGYQGNIGKNGNFNVGGQIQTQPGGRPNWGVNAGVTIKFDEQDDEFFLEDVQDDELGAMSAIKNGYYTVSNAILSRPAMIAGGMQMIQNGMARPTFLNHFDEQDDEFAAREKTEKTDKPRRKRQPLERPEGMIKRNTKLRVPKEVAADNTLFDLAELLEDN